MKTQYLDWRVTGDSVSANETSDCNTRGPGWQCKEQQLTASAMVNSGSVSEIFKVCAVPDKSQQRGPAVASLVEVAKSSIFQRAPVEVF